MLGDRRLNPEPDFLGRLDPAVDEEHGELVASPAKAGVGGPHGGPQHLGAACQGTVACEMAEAVVDRLEAVEVDEEQAEPPSVAFAPHQVDLERLVEAAPVSQSRQVVEPRLGHELEPHLASGAQDGPDDEGQKTGERRLEQQLADQDRARSLVGQRDGEGNEAGRQQRRGPARRMDGGAAGSRRPGRAGDMGCRGHRPATRRSQSELLPRTSRRAGRQIRPASRVAAAARRPGRRSR
jgi:hypothetical protein